MNKKLTRAINKAIELASNNEDADQFKHSCILLDKRHNIITYACNNCKKTHPIQALYAKQHFPSRIFLHAEVHAIIKANQITQDIHTAICIRIKRQGSLGLSFPWAICFDSLTKNGVKRIIYSTNCGINYTSV